MMFFTEVIKMFGFTTQYNNEKAEKKNDKFSKFHPIPEGMYECRIDQAEFRTTPRGKTCISIWLRIDPKYNKDYGNQVAFLQYWKRRATGEYDPITLQAIAYAACIPSGTQINSEQQFLNLIKGKHVLVHIKLKNDDYMGQDNFKNEAYPNDWYRSEHYSNEPSFAEKQQQAQQSTGNATTTQDKSQNVIPGGAEMDSLMDDIASSTKVAQDKKDKLQNNAQDKETDTITIDDEDLPF